MDQHGPSSSTPPLLDYSVRQRNTRGVLGRIVRYALVLSSGAIVGAAVARLLAPDPLYTDEAYYDLNSVSRSTQSKLPDEESVAAELTSPDFQDRVRKEIRVYAPPALINSPAARGIGGPQSRATMSINFLKRKGLIHIHTSSPSPEQAVRYAQTALAAVHDRLAKDQFNTSNEMTAVLAVMKNEDRATLVIVAGMIAGASTLAITFWMLRSEHVRRSR